MWPKTPHSVGCLRDNISPLVTQVVTNLLKSGIIRRASHSSFLSNFFLVTKDGNSKVRPIFDFSHLTKHIRSPHFKKYNKLQRLPMGLSIAPFVIRQFINTIINTIRHKLTRVQGHINDILMAHTDPLCLRKVVLDLLEKLTAINWKLNVKKAVLNPVKEIIFLGAIWNKDSKKLLTDWQQIGTWLKKCNSPKNSYKEHVESSITTPVSLDISMQSLTGS